MDPQKPGLFSSISIGRASKNKHTGEALAHPLLAATSSSTSLPTSDSSQPDTTSQPPPLRHKSSGSWSKNTGDAVNLPYKPRQRHGGGMGSISSAGSIFGSAGAPSPNIQLTPTGGSSGAPIAPAPVLAPPTTSTSTSTTFALPPSHSDPPVQAKESAASTTASSPHANSSSLTSRLQVQSLKAAAQGIGLGNGSMGMSMIDAIFDKGQLGRAKAGEGGDWGELLRTLMGGKAILLLPTTPSSSLPMTPPTLRDHVAFLSPPVSVVSSSFKSMQSASETEEKADLKEEQFCTLNILVTLSGLIGTLKGTTLSFESTIPPDSPLLHALKNHSSRQTALASLRSTQISYINYPSYTLSSETAILPFPPHSKTAPPIQSEIKERERLSQGKLGRINPFSSLFGGSNTSLSYETKTGASPSSKPEVIPSDTGLSPPRSPPSSPGPSSPKPSALSIDPDAASISSDSVVGEGYQVIAYTVSRPIRYHEIHKSLLKSVRTDVRDALSNIPEKVVEKVLKLALANTCPSGQLISEELLKGHRSHGSSHEQDGSAWLLDFRNPTETGERLQDFVERVYDELVAYYRQEVNGGLKRKVSGGTWVRGTHNIEKDKEKEVELGERQREERKRRDREEMVEKEASEGTERIEGLLCRLLYNRLFSPLESDDSKHDEALASRIAALNMLELSLDHLGLITRPEREHWEGIISNGLDRIIDNVGKEFQKLSLTTCITPKDKTEVLINAHKIVVDGLSGLPDIELRPEGEPYQKPREVSAAPSNASVDPIVLKPHPFPIASEGSLTPSRRSIEPPTAPLSRNISASSDMKSNASDPLSLANIELTPHAVAVDPIVDQSASTSQFTHDNETQQAALTPLQEALSDSVMTVTAAPVSHDSLLLDDAASVPPPNTSSDKQTKASKKSTSGADLILPIIIYAVVKSNPPQLASQLMYLRRYRSAICLTGEASYAIVNLTAVVEFLEHVNLSELGLGSDSDKVMSIEDLSPIGLDYLGMDGGSGDAESIANASTKLRGRVGEFAGSAAGSANKVISGVVDTSWSALRGLMGNPNAGAPDGDEQAAGNNSRPGMRPRQASTFSLASVTASVASIAAAAASRNRSRADSRVSEQVWGGNQELVEVSSRPGSIRERESDYPTSEEDISDDGELEPDATSSRSRMRSATNASSRSAKEKDDGPKQERVSLSNRLASIGVLGRLSNPANSAGGESTLASNDGTHGPSKSILQSLTTARSASNSQNHTRRSSLLGGSQTESQQYKASSPRGNLPALPSNDASFGSHALLDEVDPPIDKFMKCDVGDLRLSDIGELLRDYRRLGTIVALANNK
ncbi:guanyl-nucleotide exchange factor [Cryptococcus neoformans 125.91]|nr:guanyl-nucleotide exchange factor [Cryptococcus neoformans var. grubii 125.91]